MSKEIQIKQVLHQPKEIGIYYLACVVMPNGEIISLGKSVGFYSKYRNELYGKMEVK